ncbi:alpha/beta hydrolase [Reichenbachiella versicolor]|uniref:alpha/beta hydrolase n=1 Tax=Reichenbachiella versicolor TaxID=1821036 RepID=UPI000D6E038A|nr:alpha/beta fold hydrolase [Reichenbachiella versicolor]
MHTLIQKMKMLNNLIKWLISLTLLIVILFAIVYYYPSFDVKFNKNESHLSFRSAKENANNLISNEPAEVNQECSSFVLDHGNKTEIVVVLFHGYTNCPKQFEILANQLYAKGFNVFVPRMPYHGYSDVATDDFGKLRKEDLLKYIHESMEIASGLGESVRTIAISGGATLAACAAYYYDNVDVAVLSSPFFLPKLSLPFDYSQNFVINTLKIMPPEFKWWNDSIQDNATSGPLHAYPRIHTKGILAFIEIAAQLRKDLESGQFPQQKSRIVFIKSMGDQSVRNDVIDEYAELWRGYENTEVLEYTLDPELGLKHDYLEPLQSFARIDVVYPLLIDFLQN